MVQTSLNIDDEWGDEVFFDAISRSFNVRLDDGSLDECRTVGDLFEIIKSKIVYDRYSMKCASAMGLYRIRKAIISLGIDTDKVRPESKLSQYHHSDLQAVSRYMRDKYSLKLDLSAPAYDALSYLSMALILWGPILSFTFLTLVSGLLSADY